MAGDSPRLGSSTQRAPRSSLGSASSARRVLHHEANVVKGRRGAVLSRGLILKTDFYPSGRALDLDFHLQGCPNFRMSESLDVYGTAQPSLHGLKTCLSLLNSDPDKVAARTTTWICAREEPVIYIGGRPFVLRDVLRPLQTLALSDRAENLEEIEVRLKEDLLNEAKRFGGLVMVHEEVQDGQILSTWIQADSSTIMSIREMFETIAKIGYRVVYHRIPTPSDQNQEDGSLDRYLDVIRNVPLGSPLVLNCGAGIVRTTFAMICSIAIRRRLSMAQGGKDVFNSSRSGPRPSTDGTQSPALPPVRKLQQASDDQMRTTSLLRMMDVMQKTLSPKSQQVVLELCLSTPALLEGLRNAISGNFDMVTALVSCLSDGSHVKRLADAIIDHCDDVVNLRESILRHRLLFATIAMDQDEKEREIRKALNHLERYFFIVAFMGFLEDEAFLSRSFSSWLNERSEITNMIVRMRRRSHFFFQFAPVHDLSAISRGLAGSGSLRTSTDLARTRFDDAAREGSTVIGDEYATQIVLNRNGMTLRSGMILKADIWYRGSAIETESQSVVRGAVNFRRIADAQLYALSQPTEEGLDGVLAVLKRESPASEGIDPPVFWLNLREEPILYINGQPYVLRQEAVSLRNIKSYAGISTSRLESLEDRLKEDVLAELKAFDGRLLLHTEREDGLVVPIWEPVEAHHVKTLQEVMSQGRTKDAAVALTYRRIPTTAEKAPDFNDVKQLVHVIAQAYTKQASLVVNCQLGRGRSTLASVMVVLVQTWLKHGTLTAASSDVVKASIRPRLSWQVINNLLRVIRHGHEIKAAVDQAILECSDQIDLIGAIEDARQSALATEDEKAKAEWTQRALHNLRRYFFLILFSAYLNETRAETLRDLQDETSFGDFVSSRPVFATIQKEIDDLGAQALVPLEKVDSSQIAGSDEVTRVVTRRSGRILSAQTILKSDFFSNLQKLSLPERVDGVPNFRRIPLFLRGERSDIHQQPAQWIFGTGMPSVQGMRSALDKMEASPDHERVAVWTSMREEPVIYIAGRPHVLRLLDAPLENVVTTGVTASTVEAMEQALKNDIIAEIEQNAGRLLLHDEKPDDSGSFDLTAVWEQVTKADILTPREVFESLKSTGYPVDYERLPVTDEQAPIPGVFARLEARVRAAITNPELALVFNCQMGRGRTTTAMVAASLVANIIFSPDQSTITEAEGSEVDGASLLGESWQDDREELTYLSGDYKVILRLVSVLQYGQAAKQMTDRSIDAMAGVQNLRKAIYDYKIRSESAGHPAKAKKIAKMGQNYVYRYGSLIAFASYLYEKSAGAPKQQTFPQWLSERREISALLAASTLD